MHLLDLPYETLRDILTKVGVEELRRSTNYRIICKSLYQVVCDIPFLPDLRLSARFLHQSRRSNSLFYQTLIPRLKRCSIRLTGHPSAEKSESAWLTEPEEDDEDDSPEPSCIICEKQEAQSNYFVTSDLHARQLKHQAWISRMYNNLDDFVDSLRQCTSLEELMLEAVETHEVAAIHIWDVLYFRTLAGLMQNLPNSVTALTLDICGLKIVSADGEPIHVCPLLAKRMGRLKSVRLRMDPICPKIFDIEDETPTIETLTVKLTLPYTTAFEEDSRHFDAKRCSQNEPTTARADVEAMIEAGNTFAKRHTLQKLNISFRDPRPRGICLTMWDCISRQYLMEPSEVFCYEDDGRLWDPWEESPTLQAVSGP